MSQIWQLKLEIEKKIKNKKNKLNDSYILNPTMERFGINKVFIGSFLETLWNSPNLVYNIIKNTELEIVKTDLAPFFVNNFYCSYLSGNYMENNLLYVITMMLKDEISNLNNKNELNTFLENTKCSYFLEEFRKMPDIQIYFKKVIMNTVEKIERNYSFREIKFKIDDILKELMKIKEDQEKKLGKKNNNNNDIDELYSIIINSKVIDLSINYSREDNSQKCNKRNEIFIQKYIPDMTLKDFQERAEEAKKANKKNLYEYYKKLEKDINSYGNEDLYSNKVLTNNMLVTNYPTYLLSFYLNDFLEVVSFIDQLIDDLMNNIILLPNSIKYICKVISLLIRNQFEDITKSEENGFISKFLIGKLLIPIISLPSFNALISDFVISRMAIKNIGVLNFILDRLFSGNLFFNNSSEGDYTPFNWLFLDKMEKILYFFDKATNIILPEFIQNYIDDQLPEDYSYEFFNENKDQLCSNISICFNITHLEHLLKGITKGQNNIYETEKENPKFKKMDRIIKRIEKYLKENNNEDDDGEEIKRLRTTLRVSISKKDKSKEKSREKSKEKEKKNKNSHNIKPKEKANEFYLYNDIIIDPKYSQLFSINNNVANFYINLNNPKLSEEEKNIIKVKNYLCNSLGNYRLLNKSDFSIGITSDTVKMLNEIKVYMSLPNFLLSNNTIPSVWYIDSILDYLKKIPEDYRKNEYKKLFNELVSNLKESIDNLDFEKLILFRNKLKYLDKSYNYYKEMKILINNIITNDNILYIVEEVSIPVDMNFVYDDNEKKFELNKSNIKEKLFEDKIAYEDPKKLFISLKTIEAFTRYFPNLTKYQSMQDISPLFIIKELKINKSIDKYFELIKEKLIKSKIIELKEYENFYQEKLRNYIMNKIYDKIYPPEPGEKDVKIFKKTMSLSWVEPNLLIDKDYIFDNMLPDILNEFKQIHEVKTPYKKLNCLKRIFAYIINLIKFNEGEDKEVGAEDITPVLNFVSIKAHPFRIFSDIEFIKIFLRDNGEYENNLINLESIYNLILDYNETNFNLSKEEYLQRCISVVK